MAGLAPIPRAKVRSATAEVAGLRRSVRKPKRMSCQKVSTDGFPPRERGYHSPDASRSLSAPWRPILSLLLYTIFRSDNNPKETLMHRPVVRLFLAQVLLLASFAMAAPNPQAAPAPACAAAASSLWAGDPLMGAIFLSPPNGCSSICSASNGQSCSPGPVGKIKSC